MPMPLSLMWNSTSAKPAGAVSFCTIHRLICPPSGVNFTAHNIDQDLFKPQRVGNDILVFHANGIEGIHDQRDYQIHHGEVIDLTGGNIGIMYLYKPSAWVFFRRRFGKASVSNCGLFSDSAHKSVLNPYCIRHWNYQPTTLQFETGVP